jgi:hypothetical protein
MAGIRNLTRIQELDDAPGTPTGADDGKTLTWSQSAGKFVYSDVGTQVELDSAIAGVVTLSPNAVLRNMVTPTAAGNTALVLRGAPSQSADIFQVRDSNNAILAKFSGGGFFVATQGASFTPAASNGVGIVIQGVASQSADLQQWQNSIASIIARVDAGGTGTFQSVRIDPLVGGGLIDLRTMAGSAGNARFLLGLSGDTYALGRFYMDGSGKMFWGSGAAAMDTVLYRAGVGQLKTDTNFYATGDIVTQGVNTAFIGRSSTSAAVIRFVTNVSGDTFDRFNVKADGTLEWGSGSGAPDIGLSRGAIGRLDLGGSFRIFNGGLLTINSNVPGMKLLGLDLTTAVGFELGNSTEAWKIRFQTNPNKGWFEIADSSGGIQHRWQAKDYLLASTGIVGWSSETNFATAQTGARDTTLYRAAAGVLKTDGRLALGTAAGSAYPLEIGQASGTLRVQLSNAGTTSGDQSGLQLIAGSNNWQIYVKGNATSFNIFDGTAAQDRLTISSTGAIAIPGTVSAAVFNGNPATAGTALIYGSVTGDGFARINIDNQGGMTWGPGNAASDLVLFRNGPGIIQFGSGSSGAFRVLHFVGSTGGIGYSVRATGADLNDRLRFDGSGILSWGDGALAVDVNLYRNSASTLRTSGSMIFDGSAQVGSNVSAGNRITAGSTTVSTAARLVALSQAIGDVVFITRGFSGQSGSLQEWQDSTPTTLAKVRADGWFLIPGMAAVGDTGAYLQANGSNVFVIARSNAANVVFVVRGMASQSGDLTQWSDSTPTVLSSITRDGSLSLSGVAGNWRTASPGSSSQVGDKISLYGTDYGLGIQASTLVAYTGLGSKFDVREVSASGQSSTGVAYHQFWTRKGLTGAVADFSAYVSTPMASGAFTLTRLNYFDLSNPSLQSSAVLTDAAVFRFDAAAGTHKAVDASSTKTTPGTVDAWVKVNINGTIYYMPAYTSKTT